MSEPTFGAYLRAVRLERDLSLREVARRANVSPSYLSDIETDRRLPAQGVMTNLSRALGLELRDLQRRARRIPYDELVAENERLRLQLLRATGEKLKAGIESDRH